MAGFCKLEYVHVGKTPSHYAQVRFVANLCGARRGRAGVLHAQIFDACLPPEFGPYRVADIEGSCMCMPDAAAIGACMRHAPLVPLNRGKVTDEPMALRTKRSCGRPPCACARLCLAKLLPRQGTERIC